MSNYLDTIKSAREKGILLDSCGSDERVYSWGLYSDFCGLSIEDVLKGQNTFPPSSGENPDKKTNTVLISANKTAGEKYEVVLNITSAPTSEVIVSMTIDGSSYTITVPAGTTSYNTGIMLDSKYATVTNISVASSDETYTYKYVNNIKDGNFTLEFKYPDGTVAATYTLKAGASGITFPETPQEYEVGYDFIWKDKNGNEVTEDSFVMPEENTSLTSEALIHKFTLKIYGQDGTTTEVGNVNYGTKFSQIPELQNTTIEGYNFINWYTDSEFTDVLPTSMPDSENETYEIYGKWEIKSHTIKFFIDGVEKQEWRLTYNYGETISEITYEPEKEGYTFNKWAYVGYISLPATMPDADIVANAQFIINQYTITWKITGENDKVDTYDFGAQVTPYAPSKEGYTFSGWDGEVPATMPSQDIVFNGSFTINEYSLDYYVDGVLYSAETYNFGEEIVPINNPEMEGYTFSGWDDVVPATMPSHNVELYGTFDINTYTVTYKVDGETYHVDEYEYHESIVPIANPSREGYTFSGWDEIPQIMPAENIVINGTFTINEYTITYVLDGEPYSAETYNFGEQVTPIENPDPREGYTFGGWENVPLTMPANNVTVNGEFTINSHKLRYFVDDVLYSSITYNYGDDIIPIQAPDAREGYTFSGWGELPVTMPDNDIETRGAFNINSYIILYKVDGSNYSSETYEYNEIITPISEPTPIIGYTFSGWSDIPQRMPANDITVSGEFLINAWTATYNISGETEQLVNPSQSAFTREYNYGQIVEYPDLSVNSGYTLSWDMDYVTMPDNDIIINGIVSQLANVTETFYGDLPFNWKTKEVGEYDANTIKSLNSIDGKSETNNVEFVIPGSEEYIEIEDLFNEGEITEKEFDDWLKVHNMVHTIAVPTTMKSIVSLTDNDGAIYQLTEDGILTIDGVEYTILYYTDSSDFSSLALGPTDMAFNLIIKIEL